MKEVDADVVALQEVDIGCERSDKVDVGEFSPGILAKTRDQITWSCRQARVGYDCRTCTAGCSFNLLFVRAELCSQPGY